MATLLVLVQVLALAALLDGLVSLACPGLVLRVIRRWYEPLAQRPLLGSNRLAGAGVAAGCAGCLYLLVPPAGWLAWAGAAVAMLGMWVGLAIMLQSPGFQQERERHLGDLRTGQLRTVGLCEAAGGGLVLGVVALLG